MAFNLLFQHRYRNANKYLNITIFVAFYQKPTTNRKWFEQKLNFCRLKYKLFFFLNQQNISFKIWFFIICNQKKKNMAFQMIFCKCIKTTFIFSSRYDKSCSFSKFHFSINTALFTFSFPHQKIDNNRLFNCLLATLPFINFVSTI